MRRRSVIALGLLAFAPGSVLAETRWTTLLDGTSLDGWTPLGDANWTVKDGCVQADRSSGNCYLMSRDSYGDVEIRAEVWVSEDANSGIFIRCADPAKIADGNAYEVNIYDRRPDPDYATGAIVGVAKVSPMPKAGGRWNVMEIKAKGDRFDVTFNGVRTVQNAHDGKLATGHIALQYGLGVVKFRKVQVRAV